jgi:hypothetical protein
MAANVSAICARPLGMSVISTTGNIASAAASSGSKG